MLSKIMFNFKLLIMNLEYIQENNSAFKIKNYSFTIYASAEQLVVLANLENLNAQFIKQNIPFEDRLIKLNEVAIEQLQLLLKYTTKIGKLK